MRRFLALVVVWCLFSLAFAAVGTPPVADEAFTHPGNIQHFPEMEGKAVESMVQDDLGRYWISTRNEGVWRYDGLRFVQSGLEREVIRKLLATSDGGCAAVTRKGLFFSGEDGAWSSAFPGKGELPLLLNDIVVGRERSLWMASDWGLFHRREDRGIELHTSAQIATNMSSWFPSIRCHVVPPSVFKEINSYAGIGAIIQAFVDETTNKLVVLAVAPDSVADKAGLESGDIILEVNGRRNPLQRDIRGAEGTAFSLLVKKQDSAEPILISMTHRRHGSNVDVFRIKSICHTEDGNVIAVTVEGVLIKLNPSTEKMEVVRSATEEDKAVKVQAHSREGYYLSTTKGLWSKTTMESGSFTRLLPTSRAVNQMKCAPDGTLWISDARNVVRRYQHGNWETIAELSGKPLRGIGKDGSIWLGYDELIRYSQETSRFRHYPELRFEVLNHDGGAWFLDQQGNPFCYRAGAWKAPDEERIPFSNFIKLFTIPDNRLLALSVEGGKLALAELSHGKWKAVSTSSYSSRLSESVPLLTRYCDGRLWIVRKKVGKLGKQPWYVLSLKEEDGEWTWDKHDYYPDRPSVLRSLGTLPSGRPIAFSDNQWVLTDNGRFRIRSYPRELTEFSRFPSAYSDEGVIFASSDSEWALYAGNQVVARFSDPGPSLHHSAPVDMLVDLSHETFRCWTTWGGSRLSWYDGTTWIHSALNISGNDETPVTEMGKHQDASFWFNTDLGVIHYRPRNDAPHAILNLSHARDEGGGVLMAEAQGRDSWNLTPANELLYSFRLNGGAWTSPSRERTHHFGGLKLTRHSVEVRVYDSDFNVSVTPVFASVIIPRPVWLQPWFWVGMLVLLGLTALLLWSYIHIREVRLKAIGQREAHLRELEQMRLRLITSITHELRTPLTLILGPIERLREEIKDNPHIERIERNARRLLNTINELLDLRKLEVGAHRLNLSHGDLVDFARQVLDSFQSVAESSGVRLNFTSDAEQLPWEFDASKLDKILINLVANALKALPEGGVINLRIEPAVEGGVRLVVEDTGPGIPKDQIPHIFERFYRVEGQDGAGSLKSGTGIGLALVMEFVELHGGTIRVECPERSSPDEPATRFIIELPIQDQKSAPPENDGAEFADQRPLLLVVEDDDEIREFLLAELKSDFRIITACNGIQGIRAADENEIDLVLSDVMMDGMDGLEMTRRLKADAQTSHIPVILLTALSAKEHELEGLKIGADDYISKPFSVSILRARIQNRLETRRKLRERFATQLKVEPSRIAVTTEDEKLLEKAIAVVDENLDNPDFDSVGFVSAMAMSERNLQRKLKAITGETPRKFIRTMRMKRAAQLIHDGMGVGDAAAQVGYYDSGRFAQYFRQTHGMTPTQYKNEASS